jgi:hypothetical protein
MSSLTRLVTLAKYDVAAVVILFHNPLGQTRGELSRVPLWRLLVSLRTWITSLKEGMSELGMSSRHLDDEIIDISCSTNAFADAISQFIEELRDEEDKKSRFYKEVMVTACQLRLSPEPSDQSLISADDLSRFVKELESQHRKKSFTRRVFKSLQPLVDGLLQYTNAVDTMIQADPTAGALIYGGAKLVLQVCGDLLLLLVSLLIYVTACQWVLEIF